MQSEILDRLQAPSKAVSLLVSLALVAIWASIRLGIFGSFTMPLTYALPLLVCIWTRDKLALWGMAAAFAALHSWREFVLLPQGTIPARGFWPGYLATQLNILGTALAVHVVIALRQRLEAALRAADAANHEIRAQAEELAQQSEEASQQAEELARRHEELLERSQEIQSLNAELAGRERLLQLLMDTAGAAGSEQQALQHVLAAALELVENTTAAVVYESEGSRLGIRAVAGLGDVAAPAFVPAAGRFATLVIQEGRTASLNDTALRPDLTVLGFEGVTTPRSILAAPLRSSRGVFGALAVYARQPYEWTQDQFRLADWLADQCARVLELMRLQEHLRETSSRERARAHELETVLAAVPAAVWIAHDRDGSTITGNRFANELLGVAAGANVSLTSPDAEPAGGYRVVRDGAEVPGHALPLQRAARGEEVREAELEIVLANGELRHLAGNAVPLRDSGGAPRGSVAAFVDITARRRVEQELRDSGRRKSEFLAVLSHELRNPLAPLRYATELLRVKQPRAEAAGPLTIIERQLAHLVRLVDDLLDLTRIESDKIRLERRTVMVSAVVEQAREAAAPGIESDGHTLEVRLPDEPIVVEADPDRLVQAVTNLLNNASRYTPRGGRITLSAERGQGRIAISVSDTGIGLAPRDLGRVFDMFTQVGKPGHGGLGIGLALVKRVAELHGGSVSAHSDGPGKGARFCLELPLPSRESADSAAATTTAGTPRRAGSARRRVLVVDDNVDSASMMRALLELAGHEVCVAHDAESALGVLTSFAPEVALLDIGLPRMDGYELARRLRAHPRAASAFLVAVTGWGQPEDGERARRAGFHAHVTKPADPAGIERLILSAGR